MESELQFLFDDILAGEIGSAPDRVRAALDAGFAPVRVLNEAMVAAMAEVGRLFEAGEFYVPEMLLSARAMQAGLGELRPRLAEAGVEPAGKVVIGTVQGDLHDIGKNLVAMMLEGAGFAVFDLGTNLPPDAFAAAVREHQPAIVALSALLTTTMPMMKTTLDALREAGLLAGVKTIVGGAPVTAQFASQIGADGYAPDASQAATLVKSLLIQAARR